MVHSAILEVPGAPLGMGDPIKIYRQGIRERALFATRLLVWLSVVVGIGYAAWSAEPADDRSVFVLLWVIVSGGASIIMVPKLYTYLLEWRDVAVVYPRGIAYLHMSAWRILRWDEIVEVTRKKRSPDWNSVGGDSIINLVLVTAILVMGPTRRYTICAQGAMPIGIGRTLTSVDELMDTIQERTFKNREGHAIAVLQSGRDVTFGPVTLNLRRGIAIDRKWHAWDTACVADTNVVITPPGRLSSTILASTITIKEGDTPNADILRWLVAHRNDSIRLNESERTQS